MEYRERKESAITISRLTPSGLPTGVINVPICIGSSRKFHLMQEDSVTLNFSLPLDKESYKPIYFQVGDFIKDELFGDFYIREEQMPKYNTTTGGYDYQLRFDADYWLAENHILMLTTGGSDHEENGVWAVMGNFVRTETTWNLTGRLVEHALMVLRNFKSLGMQRLNSSEVMSDYVLVIDETTTHAGESKHIAYDGVHIISALTQMANEFECEWWFENNVLHFGKCGGEGEKQFDFLIGNRELGAGNVESMEISRNQNTYANRLYVLGGTKNIPDSYGKKLVFNIDSTGNVENKQRFWASSWENGRTKFNPYTMLKDQGTVVKNKTLSFGGANDLTPALESYANHITYYAYAYERGGTDQNVGDEVAEKLSWNEFTLHLRVRVTTSSTTNVRVMYQGSIQLVDADRNGKSIKTIVGEQNIEQVANNGDFDISVHFDDGDYLMEAGLKGQVRVMMEATYVLNGSVEPYFTNYDTPYHDSHGTFYYPQGKVFSARIQWLENNNIYKVMFNPDSNFNGVGRTYSFCFVDDKGNYVSSPVGFNVSQSVMLLDYNPLEIPFAWWTTDMDNPSSMLSLGERRLHLPLDLSPGGYVQKDELADEQIVEQLVRADDIYPRCYLRVTNVETEDRVANQEYSDGTKWAWPWTAYKVTLEQLNGREFPFKRKYVQEGEKLQALFLSEMDTERAYYEMGVPIPIDERQYLLAGMTFDVGFEELSQNLRTYTLIRNNDYGTMLPNDILCPKVGDVLVLIGWDVRAMEDLNLISTAEDTLFDWAVDYLDAIEEGQWTFTCHMMSDWPFILFGDHQYDSEQFIEQEEKPFEDEEDRDVYVRLGKNKYGYVPFKTEDAKWFFEQKGQFYVRNTEYYILPTEGARVRILHDALKGGEKESRIIGYELKLDKPYDSPTFTVGETEAYSRIKQLEKKLNAQ